jgi:4-alpha-glucanotransferase
MNRETGILMHPTSLPGPYGVGDFGPAARRFVDDLVQRGHCLWQVLPLTYPGFGDSPYNCISAFAGNPLLVSPDDLCADGFCDSADLTDTRSFPANPAQFTQASVWKQSLLRKAFARFTPDAEYRRFCGENASWLEDFVLFLALKNHFEGASWNAWSKSFRSPESARKMKTVDKLAGEMDYHRFVQYLFDRQWSRLKSYANARGVKIIGDLPIYTAYDSADVWSHRDRFRLDFEGLPTVVAGVPPDYFSATGQLWGNPIYHWPRLKEAGYDWWLERLGRLAEHVDYIRIDHFIGFVRYWEVPYGETTAINGRFVEGPGYDFFNAVLRKYPDLKIIAEDLGLLTPEVIALKNHYGFPGMKVLHFMFWDNKSPIDFEENCLVYTGTHDNNTTLGWYRGLSEGDLAEVHRWLPTTGATVVKDLIALARRSPARIVMVPMQDVLELGAEARMNLPGASSGNWSWRMERPEW